MILATSRQSQLSVITILVITCVLVYGLFTRPLVFPFYLPSAVRVVIELIPLLLLLLSFRNKFRSDIFILFPLFLFLVINYLANEAILQTSFLIFVRLAFFLLMLDLLNSDISARKLLRKYLVNFWMLVSISVIFGFVLYWIYEPAFSFAPLDIGDGGDGYGYFNNPLLGNIRKIYMFGFQVPKPTWYFVEPGPLSCFLAMNFVGAKYLVSDELQCNRFKYISLIAGLCTLSVTFYIFLVLFFVLKIIGKFGFFTKLILIGFLALFVFTWFTGGFDWLNIFFQENTSQADRIERVGIISELISKYPEKTFLIGHGAELHGMGFDMGVSSGWLVHFAERGFFFTIFLACYLLYLLRSNMPIFFVVVFYSFSFEFFEYPIFSIMLSLIILSGDIVLCRRQNCEMSKQDVLLH